VGFDYPQESYEYKHKRVNWEYSILINTNITNICFTYNNKLMKVIDGMIYLDEIDKWVTIEDYEEYIEYKLNTNTNG